MNDKEINIAIAEACGWRDIRRPTEDKYHDLPTDTLCFLMGRVSGLRPGKIHVENSEPLPNYCNDLNAMHEAEKTLTLQQLVDMQILITHFEGILPFHSTAHQRAEAFLRTIGKWKEAAK